MPFIVKYLWLIPVLPLLAAALSAVASQRRRTLAASLAIGSMVLSLALSLCAFATALAHAGSSQVTRYVFNFRWFQLGDNWFELGWMLDPLTAVMLVMVCFVGLLIFIYSVGYMAHDENFTRFFCFLSLFAAAMLGVVIANNLLLLFICWEIVGLTSYLLIGFWYHKPSAAAAAKKAFITTRIGDLAFLLGMVWLYSQTGTLLFYTDHGRGCLQEGALGQLVAQTTSPGMLVSTAIGLLIFCGAIGKSGQVPLHVWLPDAMEGPTPVSALIHAATMVAAGVFLVARAYPLMSAAPVGAPPDTATLHVITWIGVITAVFAATIAVAQTDIKRILAYSTVSQLGFMMMGLGMGGVAVGMFHLITHAFFKALLFMGAGSVIHGCSDEQDIRCMGGLRKIMPITFATYAVGMMALSVVPVFFSGFWSKDEILHAAHTWKGGATHLPFYLGIFGALLTAFYMTRQMYYVFAGECRLGFGRPTISEKVTLEHAGEPVKAHSAIQHATGPHESPPVMTVPLGILAAFSILLGFFGTPAWPWFQRFLEGQEVHFDFANLTHPDVMSVMLTSTVVVVLGIVVGWWLYGRRGLSRTDGDVLARAQPEIFTLLQRKYYVDEAYDWAVVGLNSWFSRACDLIDRFVWNGAVWLVSYLIIGLSWVSRLFDEQVINPGFDQGCKGVTKGGGLMSHLQDGRVQHYLRVIGVALTVLALLVIWGCRAS